jgi:hypothetical protein
VGLLDSNGTVVGLPRRWLRLDGLVLLILSIVLFFTQDQPWWLIPVVLFLPDVFMAGYAGGSRFGATVYNLGHTYMLPVVLAGASLWRHWPLGVALGLLWLAHIGMDRVLGFGLKYPDSFRHTHLGIIGRPSKST